MRRALLFLCATLLGPPANAATISPSTAMVNQGLRQEKEGNFSAARASFDRAAALDPANFLAYYYRGELRSHQGDSQGALADVNRTLALNPHFNAAYSLRGMIEIGKGDLAAGGADIARAHSLTTLQADRLSVAPDSRRVTCKISDDDIDVGDTAVVTVCLTNCDSGITHYPVPDGLLISGQTCSTLFSTSGGHAKRETDFTFTLKALRPGDYLIPAFTLPQKSGQVVVPAVRLKVSS